MSPAVMVAEPRAVTRCRRRRRGGEPGRARRRRASLRLSDESPPAAPPCRAAGRARLAARTSTVTTPPSAAVARASAAGPPSATVVGAGVPSRARRERDAQPRATRARRPRVHRQRRDRGARRARDGATAEADLLGARRASTAIREAFDVGVLGRRRTFRSSAPEAAGSLRHRREDAPVRPLRARSARRPCGRCPRWARAGRRARSRPRRGAPRSSRAGRRRRGPPRSRWSASARPARPGARAGSPMPRLRFFGGPASPTPARAATGRRGALLPLDRRRAASTRCRRPRG